MLSQFAHWPPVNARPSIAGSAPRSSSPVKWQRLRVPCVFSAKPVLLMHRRLLLSLAAALSALTALTSLPVRAQTAPTVIRIAAPEQGASGQQSFPGATPLAVAKLRGLIEDEFKKDGIKIEWTMFRGAGPAINEALAAKQLDVVYLGDLASVIGRARGLNTRLILPLVRGSNSYLAVAPGANIKSFADLKGTAYQRPFDQLLADAGLSSSWPTTWAGPTSASTVSRTTRPRIWTSSRPAACASPRPMPTRPSARPPASP